jgi:hypothetical protein
VFNYQPSLKENQPNVDHIFPKELTNYFDLKCLLDYQQEHSNELIMDITFEEKNNQKSTASTTRKCRSIMRHIHRSRSISKSKVEVEVNVKVNVESILKHRGRSRSRHRSKRRSRSRSLR